MKCPNCGLENLPDAITCDCGYNFETKQGKTIKKLGKRLGGSFKIAIPGLLLFLIGFILRSPDKLYQPALPYLFMVSGFICFVGFVFGIAEMIELILKRKLSERPDIKFVLIGILVNLIIWLSAIILFLDSAKYGLSAG